MSGHQAFIAFRRSLPRPPRLRHDVVRARGLDFAVYRTPEPEGVTAPPLLCINGGLLFDHALLWPALSPLAARRQLVLYDQRGRGRSQVPPEARAARIEHDADDIPALRAALGIARWDLLGHSWGGGIAMLAAERDQAAIRRLVLVDAVGLTGNWLGALHADAVARLGPADRAVLRALDPEALLTGDVSAHSAYARALYPAWFAPGSDLASLFAPPRSVSLAGAAVAARLRREGYDWVSLMRGLRVPTLVIHGVEDLLPVSVARNTASVLPNVRLELIPGSGHMPFWEAPQRFFETVETFLSESSSQ